MRDMGIGACRKRRALCMARASGPGSKAARWPTGRAACEVRICGA